MKRWMVFIGALLLLGGSQAHAQWVCPITNGVLQPGSQCSYTFTTLTDSDVLDARACLAIVHSFDLNVDGSNADARAKLQQCPDTSGTFCNDVAVYASDTPGATATPQPAFLKVDVTNAPGSGSAEVTVACSQTAGGGGGGSGSGLLAGSVVDLVACLSDAENKTCYANGIYQLPAGPNAWDVYGSPPAIFGGDGGSRKTLHCNNAWFRGTEDSVDDAATLRLNMAFLHDWEFRIQGNCNFDSPENDSEVTLQINSDSTGRLFFEGMHIGEDFVSTDCLYMTGNGSHATIIDSFFENCSGAAIRRLAVSGAIPPQVNRLALVRNVVQTAGNCIYQGVSGNMIELYTIANSFHCNGHYLGAAATWRMVGDAFVRASSSGPMIETAWTADRAASLIGNVSFRYNTNPVARTSAIYDVPDSTRGFRHVDLKVQMDGNATDLPLIASAGASPTQFGLEYLRFKAWADEETPAITLEPFDDNALAAMASEGTAFGKIDYGYTSELGLQNGKLTSALSTDGATFTDIANTDTDQNIATNTAPWSVLQADCITEDDTTGATIRLEDDANNALSPDITCAYPVASEVVVDVSVSCASTSCGANCCPGGSSITVGLPGPDVLPYKPGSVTCDNSAGVSFIVDSGDECDQEVGTDACSVLASCYLFVTPTADMTADILCDYTGLYGVWQTITAGEDFNLLEVLRFDAVSGFKGVGGGDTKVIIQSGAQ